MEHRQRQTRATRAGWAACGVALGCVLGMTAYAADEKAGQPPPSVQPGDGRSVVQLPPCDRPMSVKIDLSTGTTNGVTNSNGTLDPKWQLVAAPSGTGFTTPVPVYSRGPYYSYWATPAAPATWVTPWQAGGNFDATAVGGIYRYAVAFNVPSGYTNIQVSGQCRADDEGKVSLNGTQNMSPPYCHFPASSPIGTFNFSGQTGANHLRVDVQNGPGTKTTNDPTGLMVQATVTAECRPLPPIPKGDHYLCYNTERPFKQDVVLRDQFGTFKFHANMITRLCNPVEKEHDGKISPIRNKELHYVCYRGETEVVGRSVLINNQFGSTTLDVRGPTELCLPSGKMELGQPVDHDPRDQHN